MLEGWYQIPLSPHLMRMRVVLIAQEEEGIHVRSYQRGCVPICMVCTWFRRPRKPVRFVGF